VRGRKLWSEEALWMHLASGYSFENAEFVSSEPTLE
jgi:hypothetical protein